MDSDALKKSPTKTRATLKRSASTTDLGVVHLNNLNLREAKSYTLAMAINASEDFAKETDQTALKSHYNQYEIETRDAVTNEPISIPDTILNWRGKEYPLQQIAYKWKKDCRMWLWKNGTEFKKNRSIMDQKRNSK